MYISEARIAWDARLDRRLIHAIPAPEIYTTEYTFCVQTKNKTFCGRHKWKLPYALPILLTRARRNQFLQQSGDVVVTCQTCRCNMKLFTFFETFIPHSPIE